MRNHILLLLLLFGLNSKSQTIIVGDLEIMKEDLGFMTLNEAHMACRALRFGWRLPTKTELDIVYQNKSKLSLIGEGTYWSSTEVTYFPDKAWYQNFEWGSKSWDDRGEKHRAIAVRTVQPNTEEKPKN